MTVKVVVLSVSEVEMNTPLGDEVFHPAVPASYAPVTIEQLREIGPLAEETPR